MTETLEQEPVVTTTEQAPITEQTTVEATPVADVVENSSVDGGPVENSGIDEGLRALAVSYELDPDAFPNADMLNRAITNVDRVYAHHLQQVNQPKQEQKPASAEAQAANLKRLEVAVKELSGEHWDDEAKAFSKSVVEAIKQLSDYTYQTQEALHNKFGEFAPLKDKFGQVEQYMQAQAQQHYEAAMDGFFEKQGKEWEDVFGKGAISSLPPRGMHVANRLKFEQALGQVQQIDGMNGRREALESQQQRALRLAFGDQLPTIERRKLALQAHERKNGALSRPASKNGKPLPPEALAESRIAEWISKVGER